MFFVPDSRVRQRFGACERREECQPNTGKHGFSWCPAPAGMSYWLNMVSEEHTCEHYILVCSPAGIEHMYALCISSMAGNNNNNNNAFEVHFGVSR